MKNSYSSTVLNVLSSGTVKIGIHLRGQETQRFVLVLWRKNHGREQQWVDTDGIVSDIDTVSTECIVIIFFVGMMFLCPKNQGIDLLHVIFVVVVIF